MVICTEVMAVLVNVQGNEVVNAEVVRKTGGTKLEKNVGGGVPEPTPAALQLHTKTLPLRT